MAFTTSSRECSAFDQRDGCDAEQDLGRYWVVPEAAATGFPGSARAIHPLRNPVDCCSDSRECNKAGGQLPEVPLCFGRWRFSRRVLIYRLFVHEHLHGFKASISSDSKPKRRFRSAPRREQSEAPVVEVDHVMKSRS